MHARFLLIITNMKKTIEVGINAPFDLGRFNENLNDEQIKILKKIKKNVLYRSDLDDESIYDVVVIDSRLNKNNKNFKKDDKEIIYEIKNSNDLIKVFTGKYIGNIIVDNIKLKINSGYNHFFTKHLLNYSNGLFLDNSAKFDNDDENDELSILIQYLFLTTLKRASIVGLPREYQTIEEKNFNIKGKVDFVSYIKNYKNDYKGIAYSYRIRDYNKDILATLYYAMSLCDKRYVGDSFKDLKRLFSELQESITSRKFNKSMIKKAKKSPILNNQVYSLYKKVLSYAEIIINHDGFSPSIDNTKKLAVGWLIDVADLWELYLYQLISTNFPDWDVMYQEDIPIYKSLFFGRDFTPDIVMHRNKDIIIIDAKFKKLDFNEHGNDIDREDLQQVHTYFAYYHTKGFNVKYTTLVYPARKRPKDDLKLIDSLLGNLEESKFGISYLLVGDNYQEQLENERELIMRLKSEIDN